MVKVGTIGVDSGDVMLIKNKDLILWEGPDTGEMIGCKFWGRDEDEVSEILKSEGYNVERLEGTFSMLIRTSEAEVVNKIQERLQSIKSELALIVVWTPILDNPRHRRSLDFESINFPIKTGHPELCYISKTYAGDGRYDVFIDSKMAIVNFRNPAIWGGNTKTIVDTIELGEKEKFTFIDPCYLEFDSKMRKSLGITFTLEIGKYNVIHFKNEKGYLALGIEKLY